MEPYLHPMKGGGTAVIRQAVPQDAQAINEMVGAVAAEGVGLMTESVSRTVEEEMRILEGADGVDRIFLAVEVEGRIVGLMNIFKGRWKKNAHTADLGISVLRGFRGRGLGEALMRKGIEWARDAGVKRLKLGVFASNVPAVSLYRKLGFEEEGRLVGEVILDGDPVDEILMVRWL